MFNVGNYGRTHETCTGSLASFSAFSFVFSSSASHPLGDQRKREISVIYAGRKGKGGGGWGNERPLRPYLRYHVEVFMFGGFVQY